MENKEPYHIPVLLHEVIDYLNIQPNGVYVDCTFGGGGHSREILKRLGAGGRLIAFDQDIAAKQNLPADDRLLFINQNFRHLSRFLQLHELEKVDGILADLGVSSHQINEAARGFSTRMDAVLDMRMNQSATMQAADVLRTYSEARLHKIFEQFGEVTNSKTLARNICLLRQSGDIYTVQAFKKALYPMVKGNPDKYFAQVFQALRIEVNDELGALRQLLLQSPGVLEEGGRLVVISFHSLEDRLVKNFMKSGDFSGVPEKDLYGNSQPSPFKVLTKKPVRPGQEELAVNPRSRSSVLRAAQRNSREWNSLEAI